MWNYRLIVIVTIALSAAACSRHSYQGSVVKETYVHKYGVPVPKNDWEKQGKDGQIVQLCSDGSEVKRTYVEGVLHGKTTYTFPNSSTIQRTQLFDNGVLLSEIENYSTGMPLCEKRFEAEKLTKVTAWYEDGTPSLIESYNNGELSTGEYRTPLNVIESKVEHGKGIRVVRGSEGDLLYRDTIVNGEMAERISYYSNGDPSAITSYEQGRIHGQRLTFLQGGLPNTVEQWSQGKQEGVSITYQNGEKVSEITYSNGQKHGIERRFLDGTTLIAEVTWKHDVQHGPAHLFADGATKTDWYHEGELVSRNTYERMNLR